MKKIVWMVLVGVLIAVALTNPSEEQHQDRIVDRYKQDNPVSGTLGVGHVFAEAVVYHNYIFFSKTTLGEEQISIGAVRLVQVRSLDLSEFSDYLKAQLPEDLRALIER